MNKIEQTLAHADIPLADGARLNLAAYDCHDRQAATSALPEGWTLVEAVDCKTTGTGWVHASNGVWDYVAVRGTHALSDTSALVSAFLGKAPNRRVLAINAYLDRAFPDGEPERIMLGGHSLGGLLASAVALQRGWAAFTENAPGWFGSNGASDRILEIRSAGDVVGAWGRHPGRVLVLDGGDHGLESHIQKLTEDYRGVGILETTRKVSRMDGVVGNFRDAVSALRSILRSEPQSAKSRQMGGSQV